MCRHTRRRDSVRPCLRPPGERRRACGTRSRRGCSLLYQMGRVSLLCGGTMREYDCRRLLRRAGPVRGQRQNPGSDELMMGWGNDGIYQSSRDGRTAVAPEDHERGGISNESRIERSQLDKRVSGLMGACVCGHVHCHRQGQRAFATRERRLDIGRGPVWLRGCFDGCCCCRRRGRQSDGRNRFGCQRTRDAGWMIRKWIIKRRENEPLVGVLQRRHSVCVGSVAGEGRRRLGGKRRRCGHPMRECDLGGDCTRHRTSA